MRFTKANVRRLLAQYIRSEGCSCCEGEDHQEHGRQLGKLLDVPKYKDGSYAWYEVISDYGESQTETIFNALNVIEDVDRLAAALLEATAREREYDHPVGSDEWFLEVAAYLVTKRGVGFMDLDGTFCSAECSCGACRKPERGR